VFRKKQRFENYLENWWADVVATSEEASNHLDAFTIDMLISKFRTDKSFRKLQMLSMSRMPDFEILFSSVKSLIPCPTDGEAAMITTALLRADKGNKMLKKTTVIGAIFTVVALSVRNILRGR